MTKEIMLIGGGGHCGSCIDVIEQGGGFKIVGVVDKPEKLHQKILGYEIIATDDDLPHLIKEYDFFLVTLGHIKSPEKRIELFEEIKRLGGKLPVVISPLAYVSRHAKIKEGTIVMHHVLVNAGAQIGKNCIINTKALIEHDSFIGDYCHVSTGAVVNGGVKIGNGSFFGSCAVSKEYASVVANSFIKANSLFVRDNE